MARRKSVIHSDDLQSAVNLGQPVPELNAAGFNIDDIEVVREKDFRSKAQEAKFMEEKVLIEIEADDSPDAPHFIYTGHQGVSQWIERGKPQAIKRKFLYSLLSAVQVRIACAFGKDGQGNEFNRLTPNGKQTHRLQILQDNNPQGGVRWAQSVSAQLR